MIKANHLLTVPTDYQPLPVSVPPMLEQALGYQPRQFVADFISFHIGGGDDLYWDNGLATTTGSHYAWRIFIEHPKVAKLLIDQSRLPKAKERLEKMGIDAGLVSRMLESNPISAGYNFGSAEVGNEYRLMLDLRTRQLYILPDQVARDLLHQQWWPGGQPPAPPTAKQQAELEQEIDRIFLVEAGVQLPLIGFERHPVSNSLADIRRQMDAETDLCRQIQSWLDSHDYNPPARPDDAPGA